LDLNFDLNLVHSQKILLTPQLKQAMDILRMNSQELFEYVEEQLEMNPVLEAYERGGDWDGDSNMVYIGDFDWDLDNDAAELNAEHEETVEKKRRGRRDVKPVYRLSMKEHLLFQLHTADLEKSQMLIGEYLINNINDNGYLAIDLKEAAEQFNVPVHEVEEVLEYLQTFDPPGICARNLKECLLIQLRQRGNTDRNVIKIVENHLCRLATNQIAEVARSTGLTYEKVNEAFNIIRSLEPKPGRAFSSGDGVKFIVPDVVVKKKLKNFEVIINEDSIPLIGINNYYRNIMSRSNSAETCKYIQEMIDSAVWLINCIEERTRFLQKVAECIVERQRDFFENGSDFKKKLDIQSVSKDVGIHESILARNVAGKYIQCRWGIFEMRYFF